MTSHDDPLTAIATRVARIETRLARLSIALGVSPYGGTIGVVEGSGTLHLVDGVVTVPHLDVSLLDVRQFLTANKASPGDYPVYCGSHRVAVISLT